MVFSRCGVARFIAGWVLLCLCSLASATFFPTETPGTTVFGDKEYVRYLGAPMSQTTTFPRGSKTYKTYTIYLYNGGSCYQYLDVHSAVVKLNGTTVFDESDFNLCQHVLKKTVTLLVTNSLYVEHSQWSWFLSGFTINIKGEGDADPLPLAPQFTSNPIVSATEKTSYSYAATAFDPNIGDTLSFALLQSPPGMTINSSTGLVSWLPTNDNVGLNSIRLRVTDSTGLYAEQAYTLTVANVNDVPVITSTPVLSVAQGQLYQYKVLASDPDAGDTLTYTLVNAPNGMAINAGSGLISWTPQNADVGNRAVTVRVTDVAGAKAEQAFTLVVANVNDAPVITSTPVTSVDEDAVYTYTVSASDVDAGDTLTYALRTGPAGLTLDPQTHALHWQPGNADVGDYAILLSVRDVAGAEATQSFMLRVRNTNDLPVITSAPVLQTLEDSPYAYHFIAADVDAGDVLVYSAVQLPDGAQFDAATQQLTWTPVNKDVGPHPIVLAVHDGSGTLVQQAFTLNVLNTNDAPVFTSTPVSSVDEDAVYTYTVSASDVDAGDTLTYALRTGPAGLTLDPQTHALHWQPGNADVGDYVILLSVRDAAGAEATQSFMLSVRNTNDAPVITSIPPVLVNQSVSYRYSVTANDPDAGDVLTYSLVMAPLGMMMNASGVVTWLPQQADVGIKNITVAVTDLSGVQTQQSFVLTVLNVNDAPVITSAPIVSGVVGSLYQYTLTATDADGDALSYAVMTAPAGMTITASGEVTWTPASTAAGTYVVTLLVNDGQGGVAEQTYNLTMVFPNMAPVITSMPPTSVQSNVPFVYQAVAADPNQDVLAFTGLQGAPGYSVSSNGLMQWSPDAALADAATDNDVSCRVTSLPQDVVEPQLKWHWNSSPTYSSYTQVMAAPVVAPTRDTNGDGKINSKDIPSVIFASYVTTAYQSPGVMRVVDGVSGAELWSRYGIVPGSTPAVADINGDGKPDIVIYELVSGKAQVTAVDALGNELWVYQSDQDPLPADFTSAPYIADLDGDGTAEIIVGPRVFNANGTLRWKDANGYQQYAPTLAGIAADLDLDGKQEVIVGASAYKHDGTKLFHNDGQGGAGFVAVGNFNADPYPELVVVNSGVVYLMDHLGAMIWSRTLPGALSGSGGHPTIVDVDGDGKPEIGVSTNANYFVINSDGTLRWSQPIFDPSSRSTGSTSMDLDGDGLLEIAFADERYLRIYNADNGRVLFEIPNPSGTLLEYPIFADVDNDGHGDLVVISNTLYSAGSYGVRVFSGKNNGWVTTRPLWNQYAYSINNINDDLSVPAVPVKSWLTHNTYRLNSFPEMTALADVQVDGVNVHPALTGVASGTTSSASVSATVRNRGYVDINLPVHVTLYTGEAGAETLLGEYNLPALAAKSAQLLEFPVSAAALHGRLRVEAHIVGVQAECRSNNNSAFASLFAVQVSDPLGLKDQQLFSVNIKETPVAPVFVSTPVTTTREGKIYHYIAQASDANKADGLVYKWLSHPSGMSLSPYSGLVAWVPSAAQAGSHTVSIEVRDSSGLTAVQTFNVNVVLNQPPVFSSVPVTSVISGHGYSYQAMASSVDNQPVTFALVAAPEHMNIDSNGVISGTPVVPGSFTVSVSATDTFGGSTLQTFDLLVSLNAAPVFSSNAPTRVTTGAALAYTAVAVDSNGDAVMYSLLASPAGMSVDAHTGLVRWQTTAAQQGQYAVQLKAADAYGAYSTQSFTITVSADLPPVVNSTPWMTAKVARSWSYQVQAHDPENSVLGYSLIDAPAGMVIDAATGLVVWMPSAAQLGPQAVTLRVSDGVNYVDQGFTIKVLAENVALAVSITTTPAILNPGETATISVSSTGAASAVTHQLSVNGQPLLLDANGNATFSSNTSGAYSVIATAYDGDKTVQGSATLRVRDLSDTTAPVVSIFSPVDSTRITKPGDIVAIISEANLLDYIVAISPAGKQQYTVIARGTQQVTNAVVATFDPTLLTNGQWDILVQATDLNGQQGSQKVTVRVKGDLKLGNFSFTVSDVEVPMAGIPIRVTRTYDTRRKNENLDFGHGWSVGYQDGKLEKSRPLGQYWDLNEYRSGPSNSVVRFCVEPRGKPVVTVTLPTGQVETFETTVTDACHLYVPQTDSLYFTYTPVDNTLSTLEEEDPQPMVLSGSSDADGNARELLDNGSNARYNPSLYKLTTKAGYVYHLDQDFGIRRIEDPNGNTITYTPNGIIHSSGLSVTFDRDSNGRISAIHDPNGNVRHYQYDADGNLTVASAFAVDAVTAAPSTNYTYYTEGDGLAHYLNEIHDPLGRTVLKNIYDDSPQNHGRLIAQEDSAGHRVLFNHNLTGRSSVVTNRRGYSTQYAYDDEGRILTQIDALGGSNTNVWDARGNLLQKTNPLNETTTATYSARNDVLTQTDALGHSTAYGYNLRGQELSVTDAKNKTYLMSYDTVGNLLTLTDPQNHVVGNVIGPKGLLKNTTNALNQTTRWTYDDQGRKVTEADALLHTTVYTYDTNGNVLSETRTRTVNGTPVNETTTHAYDARNREISTTDAQGNTTRIEYDVVGLESVRIDAKGRRTETDHDVYGRVTQTRYPDGTAENNSYDSEGNRISSTDRLNRTTSYEFDALNRLTKTTYPDDVQGCTNAAGAGCAGAANHTQTEYDGAGRVVAEVDAKGNRSSYVYDAAGHRTQSTDALGKTRTWAFDENGNLVSETDALNHTTQYTLDELSRRTQTTYADGNTEKNTYDALGRVIEKTDANNRKTTFSFDAIGRLTQVKDAKDQLTTFAFDELGHKLSQTDANNHSTQWSYDSLGRVLTHTLPLGQVESFTYDENGNVKTHTDFNGHVSTMFYDINDRTRQINYADTGKTLTSYDAVGNRTQSDDTQLNANGSAYSTHITYAYDNRDRLTQQTNPDGSALGYEYDANGNRQKLISTYPNASNSTTTYAYDALNRLASVTGAEGTSTYAYDDAGRKTEERLANGLSTTWVYNNRNAITRQISKKADLSVLRDDVFTLDAQNRRTQVQEINGRNTAYVYDELGRLTSETQSGSSAAAYSATYQYDAVGNRTQATVNGNTITYAYDANDRLQSENSSQQGSTAYSYDTAGSLLHKQSAANDTQYQYNTRMRLLRSIGASGSTDYLYDADGSRISKSNGGQLTRYLVDSNRSYAQVLAELNASGQVQASYTLANDNSRLAQNSSNGFRFYLRDAHGSVRSLTDSNNAVTQAYDFDAFGNALLTSILPGETENNFRYSGEQLDAESQTYYLRARNYDPANGRFTQWDSFEGIEADPLSLNHYVYGSSDSVNRVDPSGQFSLTEGATVANILGMGTIAIDSSFYLLEGDYEGAATVAARDAALWALGVGVGKALAPLSKAAIGLFSRNFWAPMEAGLASSGAVLTRNMEAVMARWGMAGWVKPAGWQAHHIVSEAYPEGAEAMAILRKLKIDVNSPLNGVYLPGCGWRGSTGVAGLAVHCGPHVQEYARYVLKELNEVGGSNASVTSVVNVLNKIRQELMHGELFLNARGNL